MPKWSSRLKGSLGGLVVCCLLAAVVAALFTARPAVPETALTLPTGSTPASQTENQVRQAYGKLPVSFEQNQGQFDPQVEYAARGAGYSLFLSGQQMTLSLKKNVSNAGKAAEDSATNSVVTMEWLGANPSPQVQGGGLQEGKTNYFRGSDPAKWLTNLPNYGQVRYGEIYPGIDLLFYGQGQQLEYDFVVKPGADPAQIRLDFRGASGLEVDGQGQLVLHTDGGDIIQPAPTIYQEIAGKRQMVSGGYVLEGSRVSFRLGGYDRTIPLVIDPVLVYSTYLGGSGIDEAVDIKVDSSGNAYITGDTYSANFPVSGGVIQPNLAGELDAFVSKLNASGTALIYSTYLGGASNEDDGASIAVDSSGNAYITGSTYSNDFPVTSGTFQISLKGEEAAFVSKLNPTGTALVYSTFLGGSEGDAGLYITLDNDGNAYITGFASSDDFPVTSGVFQTSLKGDSDAFVSKLNPTGTALVYSTFLGGSGSDSSNAITLDSEGNVYITGYATANDFPTTVGAFQPASAGSYDGFVSKLNPTGTALIFSTYLGGSNFDAGGDIKIDVEGNVYVVGVAQSSDFPTTTGALQTAHGGGYDVFVSKLTSTGTALIYSTYLGKSGYEYITDLEIDSSGNAYVVGYTTSTDYPTTGDALQSTFNGGDNDTFVSKLNASGTALLYSTYLGGSLNDYGYGLAVDSSGNMYVTGYTASSNFPTTTGAFQADFDGSIDAFVTKIGIGTPIVELTTSPNPSEPGQAVTFMATVTGTNITPTGTVTFYVDGSPVMTSALDANGHAVHSDLSLSPGQHTIAASYSGDANYTPGNQPSLIQAVGKNLPQVNLTSSANPSQVSQPVTFTATVSGSGGTPTGTVTFAVDGTPHGPVALDGSGQATYATANLSAGQHTVTASYSGDANYTQGNTPEVLQQVLSPTEPEQPPADLIGQLRVTPDRVAANDSENLVSYTFTVKNAGQGKAAAVSLSLPIDPQLVVGYTEFSDPNVWVSGVTSGSVLVSLPALENSQAVSGTIVFRPNAETVPAAGSAVHTRYTLDWTNPSGSHGTSLSNAVSFVFGGPGSNFDVSGGEVQLMTAGEPDGTKIVYHADFFIPNEIVTAWVTKPDGTSEALKQDQATADADGHFMVTVDTAGWAPGSYIVATYGARSSTYGSGLLEITATGSSQARVQTHPATRVSLKVLGDKAVIRTFSSK